MKNDIVTINGQKYDSTTGLPIAKPVAKESKVIQSIAQKSQTLYRHATGRPRSMDIARSKDVSHFAKKLASSPLKVAQRTPDIKPVKHPLATKVEKKRSLSKNVAIKQQQPVHKSPKTIKDEAIAEALKKPAVKPEKKNIFKRHPKIFNIFSVGAVLLLIAGYFTYTNMPSLSVRVASAQAGIKATYPEYKPDGYSLNGPVAYSDGEVTINFRANTGNSEFVIEQSKSSWDSSAVKNKVEKDSKGQFITTEERGLTVYTYGGNASWVNGGILYTISGDAPLSGDQIRRIAASL